MFAILEKRAKPLTKKEKYGIIIRWQFWHRRGAPLGSAKMVSLKIKNKNVPKA